VTMLLPAEDRHSYRQDYLEDSLVILLGGRMAENLVFGVVSTGASNDLVSATEKAKKMVREWGMSDRVGPMAWGSHNQVFLGEDLMSTRDYSDETATVIDEEVQRILTEGEDRCRTLLTENRHALTLIARALLERETISGEEVNRLVGLSTDTGSGGDTSQTTVDESAGEASGTVSSPSPAPVD
ncbi:MAG TPA: cell division protein FtsH, partial [Acidimicrobiales bacterium]|nr:cell division protein FtsH [Acidimicrobiales bacterium]